MPFNPPRLLLLASVAAVPLVMPSAAMAEDTSADTSSASDSAAPANPGDIVVTGSRLKNAQEIDNRRKSMVVVDTLAQDDTGDLADQSLSEALARVVGVSTMQTLYAEAESQYVAVRGITPDLNHVSVDGITMTSISNNGAAQRRVDLGLIPSQAARITEVYKTFTADQEAGAVGGIINIVPHSAFDKAGGKFFIDTYASISDFNKVPGKNNKGPYNDSPLSYGAKGLFSRSFGSNDQFGIVLSGNYIVKSYDEVKYNPNGRTYYNGKGGSTTPDAADYNGLYAAPQAFVSLDYTNHVTNYGGSAMFEYRPSSNWYNSLMFFNYKQIEHQNLNAATLRAFTGITNQTDEGGTLRSPDIRTEFEYQRFETQNLGAIYKSNYEFSDGSVLDFRAGYTNSLYKNKLNEEIFIARPSNLLVSYDNSGGTDRFTLNDPAVLMNAKGYSLFSARDVETRSKAKSYELKLDYARNFTPTSTGFGFKVGAGFRRMEMFRDNTYVNYTPGSVSLSGLSYDPDYRPWMFGTNVLWVDNDAFEQTVKPGLKINQSLSSTNSLSEDYDYAETVKAAFISATWANDSTRVIGGVRYDGVKYNAHVPYTINNVFQDAFQRYDGSYEHFLPSLNVLHKFTPNLRLKASYSRTIGRQAPEDIAQPETRNDTSFTISRGNPHLKPRVSDNLDANLEYYFNNGDGFLSLGAFAKTIKDDIYELKNEEVIDGATYTVSTPMNANKSKIRGIELQFVNNRIPGLPGFLRDRVGVSANVTRTWGDMDYIVDGEVRNIKQLMFQRKWMANAAVFYRFGKDNEVRFAYNYQDAYFDGIGASPWLNRGPKGNGQFSLTARIRVTDDVLIKLQAKNLLDEKMYLGTGESLEYNRGAIRTGRSFFFNLIYKP